MRRGRCCAAGAAWPTIGAPACATTMGRPVACGSPPPAGAGAAPATVRVQAQPRRIRTPRLATPLPPLSTALLPVRLVEPELDGPRSHRPARRLLTHGEADPVAPDGDDRPAELLLVGPEVVPEPIRRLHERPDLAGIPGVPDDSDQPQPGDLESALLPRPPRAWNTTATTCAPIRPGVRSAAVACAVGAAVGAAARFSTLISLSVARRGSFASSSANFRRS